MEENVGEDFYNVGQHIDSCEYDPQIISNKNRSQLIKYIKLKCFYTIKNTIIKPNKAEYEEYACKS